MRYNWYNIILYVSFRCTTWWFDICIYCKMFTVMSPVNVHRHKNFFPVMRTFKIRFPSYFQTCHGAWLTAVTVRPVMSPGLTHLILEVCPFWLPSPMSPLPPAATDLFSVSTSLGFLFHLCFLESTGKWKRTMSVFLCPIYFTCHNAPEATYVVTRFHSFHGQVIFHCACIFFTLSPRDRYLACFHILAAVNSAAVNMGGACIVSS